MFSLLSLVPLRLCAFALNLINRMRVFFFLLSWMTPLGADGVDDTIASHYAIYHEDYELLIQTLLNHSREELAHLPLDLRVYQDFDAYLSEFLKNLMGPTLFQISGYYVYPPTFGVYGDGEISDKVRITLINGILNFPENHIENLEVFTSTHLRANIHYIFRPCEGWTKDMIGCILSKLGFVSEQAKMLAKKWKELIAEMGGTEEGGIIIHYAHSIGGTETRLAKNLLSPEEQSMIRVYTIGSASLIAPQGFQNVVNYVSRRDGVCLLDPINFVQGLLDSTLNIIYIDTFQGTPLVDHPLSVSSYQTVIQQLGQQFIEEFGNLK
jgi:hypothetical protein